MSIQDRERNAFNKELAWSLAQERKSVKQYTNPLQVGDTVRIIGPQCKGLVGEIKVIDEHNTDEGDFYGVRFDGVEGYIFFRADEMKRVENVGIAELPF